MISNLTWQRPPPDMSEHIIQALTAAGAPFEFANAEISRQTGQDTVRQTCRVFKNANTCLSQLYANLDHFADNDLAVYDRRRLNYADAKQQAASLAVLLQNEFSVSAGTRVAIVMRNSPEWLVSFIAITSLGGIAALVNSRGSADEMAYSINSTSCEYLILDKRTATTLDGSKLNEKARIVFDLEQEFSAQVSTGLELMLDHTAKLPQVECDSDDVALILYTSGTTGRPKGALLSHRGVLNALKANEYSSAIIGSVMAEKMGIDLQTLASYAPQAATLLMFPLFHVSGCHSVFLANLIKGGKLVMLSRWDAETALQIIQDEKVTTFPGVPTMYWDLLNNSAIDQYDVSSLNSLSVAGQATPVSLLNAISHAFPNTILGSGYGMTETNGVISMIHGEDYLVNAESVGRVLSIADVKIETPEKTTAALGETGEICIRGATVMLGYDNQPEANQDCFKDGWFHTGDVGYLDQDGRLFIVDRITDMVICGGENIYCAEVERVLLKADGVLETTTFGVSDERLGERLIALVILQEGAIKSTEHLRQWCADHLASYKVPAELYVLTQSLPRNATGKVVKASARELYQTLSRRAQKDDKNTEQQQ